MPHLYVIGSTEVLEQDFILNLKEYVESLHKFTTFLNFPRPYCQYVKKYFFKTQDNLFDNFLN